jgi:hypothetical protein
MSSDAAATQRDPTGALIHALPTPAAASDLDQLAQLLVDAVESRV